MNNKVVTRFAPSPTGHLHVGSARTALFCYLFAKQNNGTYLLRIEDTDTDRNKKEFEVAILEAFQWLKIISDTAPVRQSESLNTHQEALQILVENGSAYEAEESESGFGHVIRFKNPNKTIILQDIIRGTITADTTDLKDFIIARNRNEPLYHLAVVVDDANSKVTHVIRAEEHISNTPRQILILEALGYNRPQYAHIPLILATDKSKLSKRHGAVSVLDFRDEGILPEALVNYLALLGWHPKDDREILSMSDLIEEFDLSRVQKGGAIFDIKKLHSINRRYIQMLTDTQFLQELRKHLPEAIFERLERKNDLLVSMIPTLRERIEIFSDIRKLAENGDLDYFMVPPQYEKAHLSWKNDTPAKTREYLAAALTLLENYSGPFSEDNIKSVLWNYAIQKGKGNVLWPLRYALSGKEKSPDPFILAEILGKQETISRIYHALSLLS